MVSTEIIQKKADTAIYNLTQQLQEARLKVIQLEGALEGIKLFAAELQKEQEDVRGQESTR